MRGEVTHVIASDAADLEKYRGELEGKIVLFGEAIQAKPSDKPIFTRLSDADLAKGAIFRPPAPHARDPEAVKRYQFRADYIKFFTEEHVAAVLDITREPGDDGTIQLQSGGPSKKVKPSAFPASRWRWSASGASRGCWPKRCRWKWKLT